MVVNVKELIQVFLFLSLSQKKIDFSHPTFLKTQSETILRVSSQHRENYTNVRSDKSVVIYREALLFV